MNNGKIWGSSACNQRRLLCFVISIVFVFTSVLPPLSAGADSDTSIPPDPGPAITDESYITVEPPVSSVGTSADPGVISDTTSGSGTISETDTISDIGATSGSGSGTTSEPGPDMTSGPGSGMVPETEFGITADTEIGPILFDGWNNSYDGVIKANYYWVGAAFISTGESEIESIEFEISTDDANWSLIPPGMIYSEYEDYNSELNGMYRELELDFTDYIDYISYDTLYIRARATDKEGNKRTETTALTVDVLYVNNLKAEPNEENNAIVLTWENPVEENFSHAIVKRLEKYGGGYKSSEPTPADYGGSGSWWYLDSTAENTYIDRDVSPYKEYRYRVIAVDDEWYEGIPVEATAQLVTTGPVMLAYWDIGNDGKVNAYYVDDYSICAYFYALDEIRSIDYEISSDNLNWTAIPTEWILYDYDLYYDDWRNTWGRYIEIDLTDYGQGDLYIRATARDENSVTATATAHLVIDLVCEAATDCSAAPNEDNTAIELSWSVPDDYDYAELYRENYNGMPWGCIDELTGTTYTDTNINKDNPYITYRYKIIIYDKHGNKSLETQPFSARLNTPGPISLKDFSTDIEDGRINRNDASRCYLSASFFSEKPLTQIQYDYSIDGTTWHDLRPFISEDQRLQREEKDFYYWRFIRMNIGPNSGVPDGPISIRATAVDEDGNSLEAKVDLVKDATPPQPVIDISAVPKEDNTGIVLTWTNPTDEDFKYLVINRGSYTSITPVDFNEETFTDTEVEVGTEYTYKFITYDEFGNASLIQPEIKTSILTDGPVIDTMYPDDGIRTNADTLSYSARFRSSLAVERIHFEISNDDGESWTTLRDVVPEKTYNEYYSSGSWDISEIGEEKWLLRATAYDTSGRSSSETRAIHIDHVAPPPPTNFKAEITSTSPNTISFSWDPVENAQRYSLSRIYANPADGSYNPSYTIYAPDTTAELSYDIKSETPYIFTIMAQDLAGNWGDPISLPYVVEIFTGPSITFDKGYVVYTNETDYVLSGKVEPGVVVAIYDKTKGGDFQPLSTDEEGNFSYSTVLSSENSGNNDFTIRAEKGGLTHTVKHRAVYDTTPPKISSFSPDDGNLVTGKKVKISLSISGSSASIARKTVQITQDDVNWYDVIEIPPDKNEVYWDTTVPVEGLGILEDGTYKVRAFILDKAGNQTEGPPRLWILDNTKPEPPTGLTITPEYLLRRYNGAVWRCLLLCSDGYG
jgi:fibronectin type 3 domain-containing protein